MTAVAILADDAATRDGIARLLEDAPGLEVVGAAEDEGTLVHLLESVRVDVTVMVPGPDAPPAVTPALVEEAAAIVVASTGARAVAALRAGVRAVLLSPPDGAELVAAIRAVAMGLSVIPADLLDVLLQRSNEARTTVIASVEGLTPRELEVLALIAAGASNKLIARRLGISTHTAKFHVARVLEKLGAVSRAEAVGIAARLGLVLL